LVLDIVKLKILNIMNESNQVFVNRTLNMRKIKAIGFDMDYTLVRYNTQNFENDTHKLLTQKLVTEKQYSKDILKLTFDPNLVIRGLVIDTQKGNFLKLSRYRSIRTIFHGQNQINYINRREVYPTDYIDFGLDHPHFSFIESHFDIAYTSLYMQLIELKSKGLYLPTTEQIFSDICQTVEAIHTQNDIKQKVMKDPGQYIHRNPKIALALEKLIKHGKRLFLLTNSSIDYTAFLLDYTITPFLKEHSSWMGIFEIMITSANKPDFFHKQKDFQELDKQTFEVLASIPVPAKGGLYQFGCAENLTRSLQLMEDEILYIGDQVYTDVVLLKQKCGWRTALVIEELAEERKKIQSNQGLYEDIKNLMKEKTPVENKIHQLFSDQIENNHKNHNKKIHSFIRQTEKLDRELIKKITTANQSFNPFWGELMRVGAEESLFASQAERFSCIYMPYLIDFLSLSPRTYYRAKKRLFPHEM